MFGLSEDNSKKKSRMDELDEFWDISSLVPRKNVSSYRKPSIDTSAAQISAAPSAKEQKSEEQSTVIKRYVNPLHYEQKKIRREAFESTESYYPENSLLHKVTLKKRKSEYQLYEEFLADAIRYKDADASECEFAPYYSYVPQYNQLSRAQLDYYLWWRKCFREGTLIKIDYSYILLYIFELINLGERQDVRWAQEQLSEIWNVYHREYAALASKLATWICDFSLIHRLPAPENIRHSVGRRVPALKEFYLHMPKGDYEGCARSLIKYATEYDYKTSKFAKEPNIAIFDKHIFGAMLVAVKFYSKDGALLSELASEDSKLIRNCFEGALCVSEQRFEVEVKYCSFSRSNELRYILGDIVKYSENEIRTYLGVKSKLSVYSVSGELQKAIDAYFETALFSQPKPSHKKEEKHEYDVLYDLPRTEFSLDRARQIEEASWGVTKDLISAFEAESLSPEPEPEPIPEPVAESDTGDATLREALGEYLAFAEALKRRDGDACRRLAAEKSKMLDGVVDEINEIAVEIIGDVLIEEGDDGFEILDCYRDLI